MTIGAGPARRSTSHLVRELLAQSGELVIAELALVRAELGERARAAVNGAGLAAAGAALLFAGLIVLLIAVGLVLARLGVPTDVAFIIVAIVAILSGGLLLYFAKLALSAVNLVPRRSFAQIASLLRAARHEQ
jgi:hypothetical protein